MTARKGRAMSDREEWGPWIKHDGKGCPCVGMWVRMEGYNMRTNGPVVIREKIVEDSPSWNWKMASGHAGRIRLRNGRMVRSVAAVIRYRIRKPRALIQLREMIETLPAPSPKEDAHV